MQAPRTQALCLLPSKYFQFPFELYLKFLGHLFQDVITQVKDVNPVIELTFSWKYQVTLKIWPAYKQLRA